MRYTRIFSTPDGGSRLEDVDVAMAEVVPGKNLPPMLLSTPARVTDIAFVAHTPGAERAWGAHPAPRSQFVILLAGRLRVETTDGATRDFGPGDVVLADDTEGQGHRTIPLTDDFCFAVIPLASMSEIEK